jgi:hypothetical protein
LTGLVVVLMAAFALPVAADELSDFEAARRNYDKQSYAKAARGLESLVGGVIPRARNPVVRLEARKYLGATYLFLGKDGDAREQFRLLLEEDPDYDIDPVAFPEAVVETFQEVQAEVTAENRKLGIMFAVTESAFLAASIATFIGHNSLRDENPAPSEIARAQRVEKALRIGNWVSVGALVSFYIAGVIEAEVRFKPVIRSTRKRELPEELQRPESRGPEVRFQLGLTGGKIRVDF